MTKGSWKLKGVLSKLLRLLISILLLTIILSKVQLKEIISVLSTLTLYDVFLLMLIFKVCICIKCFKMYKIALATGMGLTYWTTLRVYYLGSLAFTVLPSLDAAYVGLLGHRERGYGKATVTIVIDRLSGMVVVFAAGLIAMLLNPNLFNNVPRAFGYLSLLGLIVSLSLLALAFGGKRLQLVLDFIQKHLVSGEGYLFEATSAIREAADKLATCKEVLFHSLLYSVAFQASMIWLFVYMCRMLSIEISLVELASIYPYMVVAAMLPSILGIGVRDVGYVAVFSLFGVAHAKAIALSTIQLGLILLATIIGLFLFVLSTFKSDS